MKSWFLASQHKFLIFLASYAISFDMMQCLFKNLQKRVRVQEQLLGNCLFGLESTQVLGVGVTKNISFQYIEEAMF